MLELLDWDDEEAATRRNLSPHSRYLSPVGGVKRGGAAALDAGPASFASAPPTLPEAPDTITALADWELELEEDDAEITHQGPASAVREREHSSFPHIEVREAEAHADRDTLPRRNTLVSEPPLSEAPPTEVAAGSEPPSFSERSTDRRNVPAVSASGSAGEPLSESLRPSSALPLRRSVESPHSVALPLQRPARLPSVAPVALSTAPPPVESNEALRLELDRLRRRVRWSSALSLVAISCCAVLVAKLWSGAASPELTQPLAPGLAAQAPGAPALVVDDAPAPQGLKVRSSDPGVVLLVDGDERGSLPLRLDDLSAGVHELRFEGAEDQQPLERQIMVKAGEVLDLGTITLSPRKVQVTLRVPSAGVTVCIARHGHEADVLRGPYPKTLDLEPGHYALFATKQGRNLSLPLLLTLDRPERDVTIRLD